MSYGSLGSYYDSDPNYYRNPVPYLGSDIGAPVPGWGTSIQVAGPARLGVGAGPDMLVKAAALGPLTYKTGASPQTAAEEGAAEQAPPSEVGGMPWWVWPIAAGVVMGGVGFYGTKKGWF